MKGFVMKELEKDMIDGNLTQKEIIQLLLHNAQHMATRDEVKTDIKELKIDLKQDIAKVETSLKQDIAKVEEKIAKVETSLKQDIAKVETSLKQDIAKVEDKVEKIANKFDKVQWLIVATLLTVVFKDYIISFMR